jgi:hypothetical protein
MPNRRRLLKSVERGTWVASKYAVFLAKVKKSLEEGGNVGRENTAEVDGNGREENDGTAGRPAESGEDQAEDITLEELAKRLRGLSHTSPDPTNTAAKPGRMSADEMLRVLDQK